MRIRHLVIREILHRKLGFGLALMSVAVAIGSLVGAQALLRSDELETRRILNEKMNNLEIDLTRREQAVQTAGRALEDEVRKQMLGLGFNLLIIPANQDVSELHLTGQVTETMPETYVDKLANSQIVTINHLLPTVSGRVRLERGDAGAEAILQGTRGEIPLLHRALKKPLLDAVAPGMAVVGFQIQRELGLEVGDKVTIEGQEFEIAKLHPERGAADDVTVWIDLQQAQELLGLQNVIHAMLALECGCVGDRIGQIRADIAAILPGTKVIERYSTALARAEARTEAKETAQRALATERNNGEQALRSERQARDRLYDRHARFAGVLIPLAMVASAMWIGVLAVTNVRQRGPEIGIFRALGLSGGQILAVFLSRVALIGLLGGAVGCAAGLPIGARLGGTATSVAGLRSLLASDAMLRMVVLAPLAALLLAAIASWLPILSGVRKDPAAALQAE